MSKEFKMSDVKLLIDNEVYISTVYISDLMGISTCAVRKYIAGYHRRFKLEAVKVNCSYFVKEDNFRKFQEFYKKLRELEKETQIKLASLKEECKQEVA